MLLRRPDPWFESPSVATAPPGGAAPGLRTLTLALIAAGALLLAGPGQADPRWWWSDQPITSAPVDSITPHLAIAGLGGGAQGGSLFVTYAEVDALGGDHEIWLIVSVDGGCTWCGPTRLTDDALDQANPRVAALVKNDGSYTIQVVYEQEGDVVVAWDATTLSALSPRSGQCAQIPSIGPNVIANAQYEILDAAGVQADQPDQCAISRVGGVSAFHVAFRQSVPGRADIVHVHDLSGLGGAGWHVDPAKVLTALSVSTEAHSPSVACDILTDPDPISGLPTMDRTGMSVVFVEVSPAGGDRIVGLRSIDSGATFSPNGQRVDAAPGPVSDGIPGIRRSDPVVVTAASSFAFTDPAWVLSAWADGRAGGPGPQLRVDGRLLGAPILPSPNWQAPDRFVAVAPDVRDGAPTLALTYPWGGPTPAWLGWEDRTLGAAEIRYRSGILDATQAVVLDFSRHPFAPVRPADTPFSLDTQLSSCFVPGPGLACVPTRVAGEARAPSFAGDTIDTYAVWADTRDGASSIWFKKTDRSTWMPISTVAPSCEGLGIASLDVTFERGPSCPAPLAQERMQRYLVYFGTDRGGPFANAGAPLVVDDSDALGNRVTVTIPGLALARTYHVIVVPEDQARNVYPDAFDPLADNALPWANEVEVVTLPTCTPNLTVLCDTAGDRCPQDLLLDGDGNWQPGEFVDLSVSLSNSGAAALQDYSALLTVAGATVVVPAGGSISVANLAPGGTISVPVTLQLPRPPAASCGDPVDLTLVGQTSNGTLSWPDDALAGCDRSLAIPCPECAAAPEVIVTGCGVVLDTCANGGAGDGVVDPTDRIEVEVTFTNLGQGAATAFSARLAVVTGATVSGADVLGPLTLAPGASATARVMLDVTALCGGQLDCDVVDMTSDGGAFTWPDHAACEQRVGANPVSSRRTYLDSLAFSPPDGGTALNLIGVNVVDAPALDRVTVEIRGAFPNLPNLAARLIGPLGSSLDVTAALGTVLDITGGFAALGTPGHVDLEFSELLPDGIWPNVSEWNLTIDRTDADCSTCVALPCLYRSDVTSLLPHVPARGLVFGPESMDGVSLRGVAYRCPFATGEDEPDAGALTNGVALSLYQVDRLVTTLRLEKNGGTIRFTF